MEKNEDRRRLKRKADQSKCSIRARAREEQKRKIINDLVAKVPPVGFFHGRSKRRLTRGAQRRTPEAEEGEEKDYF